MTVYVDASVVRHGIELVDTPGTGSVHGHDEHTRRALQTMDAAILVLTADPPLSASERDLLAEVAAAAVRTFVIVNKADQLEPQELDTVTSFVAAQTAGVLGERPEVLTCSARAALRARISGADDRSSGLCELEAVVSGYLAAERTAGLHESVRRKADGLIARTLDGLQVRLSLSTLQVDEARRRTDMFRDRLDRIRRRRAEPTLAGAMVDAVRRWADESGAALPPVRLREDGRTFLVGRVRDVVDCWRQDQQRALETGLGQLEDRLLTGLSADLAELTAAAREILGVDLVTAPDRGRLVDNPDFFYQLSESVGWSELLTSSLRRRWVGGVSQCLSC